MTKALIVVRLHCFIQKLLESYNSYWIKMQMQTI